MSFKTIVQDVEKGLGFAAKEVATLSPLVTALYPPAGAMVSMISSFVISAESLFPTSSSGAVKKQAVVDQINAVLPLLSAGLDSAGIKLNVTPEVQTSLSNAIDEIVALFNNLAVFKTAFVAPAPKAA